MKKKEEQKAGIREITINDVPQIYASIKYFDGTIAFADQISAVPEVQKNFKVHFVAFIFCIAGHLDITLNGTEHSVSAHEALFVDANTVISYIKYTPDFECKIIIVGNNIGANFINKTIFNAIMQISHHPVVKFTQDEIDLMLKYYELAIFKIEHPHLNYGRETMMNLLRSYALDLLSSVNKHLDSDDSGILRQGDKLYHRFMMMLAGNETNERSVQYFANKLYVSPKYLTSICNEKCGCTASELIANSVVSRIRQLLQYSDKSIKEIATEMNFDNLSFFGKYVKKHLGDSPNNFRKKHSYGR